jgi:hypothetical protein
MIAAIESRAETNGRKPAGAKPSSQCFSMTKI